MTLFKKKLQWIFLVILLGISIPIVNHYDFTKKPLVGDQASHTLQALSLAYDTDLKFDINDEKHWEGLGWRENPNGLFFQKYSKGYAFAKPYAYSLFLSPFIYLFSTKGFIIGNFFILFSLNLFIYLSLIKKYSENISLGLTVTFSFFSYIYMYAFPIHSDLFLAFLMAIFVYVVATLSSDSNRNVFFFLAILIAFMVSDKIVMILIVSPITLYLFKDQSKCNIGIFILLFLASFFIFILPYLYYSDFNSWNPYAGTRYYSTSSVPFFSYVDKTGYNLYDTKKFFKLDHIVKSIFSITKLQLNLKSLYYYFFGAYTGMLVYIPLSFIVIFVSVYRIFSAKKVNVPLALSLISLFAYVLFYIILFPYNYYGGYQSLGNRYFLQISPITILLLLYLELDKLKSILIIFISILISTAFLYKHHLKPQMAFIDITKTSYLQSKMPFDDTQTPLVKYFPINQKVNKSLIPGDHYFYRAGGSMFIYNESKDIMMKCNDKFINANLPAFRETHIMESKFFVDKGFYQSEKTHIWSKKNSKLIVRNHGKKINFVITSYKPSNKIIIIINNEKLDIGEELSNKFSIDTDKIKKNWILVQFLAEKSGTPSSSAHSNSHDNRDLSFRINIQEDRTSK